MVVAALRLVLVTFWLIQWHTPVRYTFFNPVNIEPLFLAFVTAALLAIERLRARRLALQAFVVTLLVFVGVFAREAMTLLAATFVGAHWRASQRTVDRLLVVFPLLGAGTVGFVVFGRLDRRALIVGAALILLGLVVWTQAQDGSRFVVPFYHVTSERTLFASPRWVSAYRASSPPRLCAMM